MNGTNTREPILALTLGDANGIGPEIVLKVVQEPFRPKGYRFLLVGAVEALQGPAQAAQLALPPQITDIGDWPECAPVAQWNPMPTSESVWQSGRMSPEAARAAVAWLESAIDGCLAGCFAGLVTAPICKQGLVAAGMPWSGHTELLAARCRAARVGMMLMGGGLRVMLVTRHLPLSQVSLAVTPASIREALDLTHTALGWLGLSARRIAVCGLNPHAGDGGAFGTEEQRVIIPTLAQARLDGLDVQGPLAADSVFFQARAGLFDAVVAMYHDQGLGPLKTLGFETGVNLTLGLPIVRTSPDHGTAFDLAGKNQAKPSSMLAALNLAAELAGRPNPWQTT